MWDVLTMAHEGTTHVKMRKTTILMRDYRMFIMKENETIDEMFEDFHTIINGLQALGKEYTKEENNMKILDNDEISLMSRKFKEMLKKKGNYKYYLKKNDQV
ncbi:hypothetical protein CR513_22242, partial [Mucuna pruriens]